jgi:hypothetical protein
MKLGEIFRMRWAFEGKSYEGKWAVICCACGACIETSTILTTKADFIERLKAAGWFMRKDNGRWMSGNHGTVDSHSFMNRAWVIDEEAS